MNEMNNKIIVGLLVVALGFGAIGAFKKPSTIYVDKTTNQPIVGASGNFSTRSFALQGITSGGMAATSTGTITAYTPVGGDYVNTPSVIRWTPNANQTLTITSTSTQPYVPNVGDTTTIFFQNASTTAASTITFAAANANVDLQFSEATGGDLVLNGLDWAKITLIRTSTYNVTVLFDEMTEAD